MTPLSYHSSNSSLIVLETMRLLVHILDVRERILTGRYFFNLNHLFLEHRSDLSLFGIQPFSNDVLTNLGSMEMQN